MNITYKQTHVTTAIRVNTQRNTRTRAISSAHILFRVVTGMMSKVTKHAGGMMISRECKVLRCIHNENEICKVDKDITYNV